MVQMKPLLTVKEAADYYRLHKITVYRLCEQGKIKAFKVGGSWRIRQDEDKRVVKGSNR